MRTLNVSISDIEYNKFGLKKDKLAFSDFLDLVSRELAQLHLNTAIEMANKYGLSKMSMDDIDKEIKGLRNAKAHR